MSYPSSSTPVPSVHRTPGSGLNQLAFTEQQLAAIGQQLLAAFLRQVAISLLGVSGANTLAAIQGQLSAWSTELQTDVNGALANWTTLITALSTGDFPGLVTFFENQVAQLQHMGITGLYDAAIGFDNLSTSLLKYLTPTGGNIGMFDASGITGAINTGVTVAGNDIGTLLSNIDATGQFLGSAITGAINAAATVGGQAIGDVQANATSAVEQIEDAVDNALGGAAATATAFGDALAATFGGWWGNLTGNPQPAVTPASVDRGLAAVAANVAAHSTQINALSTQLLAAYSGGGLSDSVEFQTSQMVPSPRRLR